MSLYLTKTYKTISEFSIAMTIATVAMTAGSILGCAPARAASFAGSFSDPNEIFSTSFVANGTETLNFSSSSYASGNFSPILTLFDGNDTWANNDIVGTGDFNTNLVLAAGTYRAVLSVFPNYFDFFIDPQYSPLGFSSLGDFDGRGQNYAFSIVTVSPTAVPEPSSLIGIGVAGFAVVKLKRKLSSGKKLTRTVKMISIEIAS
jgi:hypothetical protein